MLSTPPLNRAFDAATPTPPFRAGCIVNYVWINDRAFRAGTGQDDPQCGVPLEYVDRALANAKRYPDTPFNIWVDFRYLEKSPTRLFLDSHLYCSGCRNIGIRDLNRVEDYNGNPFFAPSAKSQIWHRVDLARMIVTKKTLDDHPEKIAVYADFDVEDIRIKSEEFRAIMERFGSVIGGNDRDLIENGYFAFSNDTHGRALLDTILERSLARAAQVKSESRNFVFMTYWHAIVEHLQDRGAAREEISLAGIQKNPGYKIPQNADYEGVSVKLG